MYIPENVVAEKEILKVLVSFFWSKCDKGYICEEMS